jgi:acylphosphatase
LSGSERAVLVRAEGKVQGVCYRAFTREQAQKLNVRGWVRNCDDGSVEAALHGAGTALADLIGIMRAGPPDADVDKLDVRSTDREKTDRPPPDAYSF